MPKIALPSYVIEVLTKIEDHGFEAYVVGGSCRDIIIGRVPYDFDVCSSALPEDIFSIFPDSIPTGIAHGTVTVRSHGELIEVTTFRCDGDYEDHRRPDSVDFTSDLNVDLARRDFTMNAIAMDKDGNLFDPYGGISDISKKLIRCVGNAEKRFSEDALRMLRAVRFSAQLGFTLDADIIIAMEKLAHTATYLAAERVFSETTKTLMSPAPQALERSISCGIYSGYVDFTKNVNLCDIANMPEDLSARYCALCAILKKSGVISSAGEFLKKLRAPASLIKTASRILDPEPIWNETDSLPRLISIVGRSSAMALACAMGSEHIAPMQKLLREERALAISELAIGGSELQKLGISGREIGETLNKLLLHVLDFPEDNVAENLIDLL